MSSPVANERRLAILVAGMSVWALICAGRLGQVMIARGAEFHARASRQQERKLTFQPKRGEIVDAADRELAISVEASSIFAVPPEVDHPADTARALAKILGVKSGQILGRLQEDKEFVYLARKIDRETAERVKAAGLAGIHLLPDSRRVYPKGTLASQALGWVGTDNDGRAGLEYQYDREVSGRPGILTVLRDARQAGGANVWKEVVRQEPVGGRSLRLTIDSSIQYIAERELAAGVERAHATAGSVVILDPRDNAILALASWPPFDPEGDHRGNPADWRIRPITDAYEPGSTFKLVAGTAALGNGTLSESDPVDCGNGSITLGGATIHEHESKAYGIIPFSEALAVSSNVGFVRIGLAVGRETFYRQVTGFGFGQPTGVDLPGESSGILHETKSWSALSLAAIAMGQEVAITPLQLAVAFSAVANGGVVQKPFIVREVLGKDGASVRRASSIPVRRILEESVARRFAAMLEGVVDHGTGKAAAVPGYTVAGKTGTAQKAVRGGGYARDRFVASFAGFVPSRSPRLVMVVVVDEPRGAITGGRVAAPIYRAIAEPVLSYLRVPPNETEIGRVLTARLDAIPPERPILRTAALLQTGNADPGRQTELLAGARSVPDVTGLDARQAVARLAGEGLVPEILGHGIVRAQEPRAGEAVRAGTSCRIVLEPPRGPKATATDENGRTL